MFDVVVLGVGGMGSAACAHLAARGQRVLGLEQFAVGHALGSSHGESRLIRQAYFEKPEYVPLLKRAYELWDELERASGQTLFHRTGLVIYGRDREGSVVRGVRRSAALHRIPIEAGREVSWFRAAADHESVYEPGAGYLEVENCLRAYTAEARRLGADIREHERVLDWREVSGGVEVRTLNGTIAAKRLVVTAGAWAGEALGDLASRLVVRRVPLFWLEAREPGTSCFGCETESGFFYGIPSEGSVKIGLHVPGERVDDPGRLDRRVRVEELEAVRAFAAAHLPLVSARVVKDAACMYTMTPDEDFVIDVSGPVSFFAGSSGHGFKFASVVGEILADLVTRGSTVHDIGFLRASRWSA